MSIALVLAGASIFLLLGVAHTVFSLQSTPDAGPMMPTDPTVRAAMQQVGGLGMAPDLQSTLYRAWIGFNLSHSLGVVVTAAVLLVGAATDFDAAMGNRWFVAFALATPLVYLMLAINYWFDKPRDAIALAAILVWVGVVLELA